MKRRQWIAFVMMLAMLAAIVVGKLPAPQVSAAGTGVGLAEHALAAYSNGWLYRYGASGQTSGGRVYSDCSGLIYSYTGTARSSAMQISSTPQSGSFSTLPRIHGLGLWQPGHVGVYVGGGMAVDCRDTYSNTVYEAASAHGWVKWYKVPGVSYPTTGWVTFNGADYYYENGEYVVSCTKVIDGVSYTFDASGRVAGSAPGNAVQAPQVEPEPVQQPSASTGSSQTTTNSNSGSTGAAVSGSSTSTPEVITYQDLALGSQGAAVTRLQTRLAELDYYYEMANDYYDSLVMDAVSLYQKAAGLEVTGAADVATQESLFSSSAPLNEEPGTVFPGYHSSIIRQLQERLIELGYMEGETSFFYGETTEAAVLAYQTASGLEADGILTMDEQNVLFSDDAVPAPQPEEPVEEEPAEPAGDADETEESAEPADDGAEADGNGEETPAAASYTEDPADAAAASMVNSVSSAAEVTNGLFVQTVNAAVKGEQAGQADDIGNGVIAFAVVLVGATLTTTIFIVRKKKIAVRDLAAALLRRFH